MRQICFITWPKIVEEQMLEELEGNFEQSVEIKERRNDFFTYSVKKHGRWIYEI